ncbi:hypothetical protein WG8_4378 [Paenibacillus sp. Aloe-11]|nr:hypothetical protein WG8_4378 [Paenibacillus sp. Aloe-11]
MKNLQKIGPMIGLKKFVPGPLDIAFPKECGKLTWQGKLVSIHELCNSGRAEIVFPALGALNV